MRGVKVIYTLVAAFVRNAENAACLVFKEGRQLLLRRAKAATELRELAVQQQQADLDRQKASGVVELARGIEKIKDQKMREALVRALLSNSPALREVSGSGTPAPLLEQHSASL